MNFGTVAWNELKLPRQEAAMWPRRFSRIVAPIATATLFARSAGTIAANSVPTRNPPVVAVVTFCAFNTEIGIKKPFGCDSISPANLAASVSWISRSRPVTVPCKPGVFIRDLSKRLRDAVFREFFLSEERHNFLGCGAHVAPVALPIGGNCLF